MNFGTNPMLSNQMTPTPSGNNIGWLLSQAQTVWKDQACLSSDNLGAEIASLVQQLCASSSTTLSAQLLEQIAARANAAHESLHTYYASVVAAIIAQRNAQPNKAVTLWGPDNATSATYTGGDIIQLTPRIGNAIQTAFAFNKFMMFGQLVCSEQDANAGWRFAGGTVQFKGDPASGMAQDTSFDIFTETACGLQSPLQSYMYRAPLETVDFTASAFHNNTAATELKNGATLMIMDSSCKNVASIFADSVMEANFSGAVLALMQGHREQCRPSRYSFPASGPLSPTAPR